jgi:DNA modification methylase
VTAYDSRCLIGDCRDSMRELIADGVRVQMCVTSPPYWGLRDYGVSGQIGLEPTIRDYIDVLVGVFGFVRELLADDGTLWLNLGDCYAGSWGAQSREHAGKHAPNVSALSANQVKAAQIRNGTGSLSRTPGLKPKDLVMMPARVALALQDDGWWVRQDIIWHKPNPMPESVTDRCTKAHEYLFLLAKSERYYFDAAAIRESATHVGRVLNYAGDQKANSAHPEMQRTLPRGRKIEVGERRNKRSVWTLPPFPYAEAHFATFPPALVEPCVLAGSRVGDTVLDPFFGSGTVGEVAQRLGRKWIGCDLQEAYAPLQARRTAQQGFEL